MDPDSIVWLSVGPSAEGFPGGDKFLPVSGRVKAIAFSPDVDGTPTPGMFIGIDGGGVWRSTNFTDPQPEWTPLTDHLTLADPETNQPLAEFAKRGLTTVRSIAVDPHHSRRLRVANASQYLLASDDGGIGWSLIRILFPLQNFKAPFNEMQKVFFDPTDATGNTVYALGTFGFNPTIALTAVSADGGATWSHVIGNLPPTLDVLDLEYTFSGISLTLFALAFDRTGQAPGQTGVWVSSDRGKAWSQLPLTLVNTKNLAIDPKTIRDSTLATRRVEGTTDVYLAVADRVVVKNVFKLVNGTLVPIGKGFRSQGKTSGYAMGVSPDGVVYLGELGLILQLVADNGTWTDVELVGKDNLVIPHVDRHSWGFHAGAVYSGNDGGLWRFTPLPAKKPGLGSWQSLNTPSLASHMVGGVGLHATRGNVLLAGTQDNGAALRTSGGKWYHVESLDVGKIRFDPDPKKKVWPAYFSGYGDSRFDGNLFWVSSDNGQTFKDVTKKLHLDPVQYQVVGGPPFAIDPQNTARVLLALHEVYETRDLGATWTRISPNLKTGLFTLQGVDVVGKLVVTGADDVFVSTNGGGDGSFKNWHRVNFDWRAIVRCLTIDPFSKKIYLGTNKGTIFRVTSDGTDAGTKVEELTRSFPGGQVNAIALKAALTVDPLVFAATDVGVFFLDASSPNAAWRRFGQGLPEVSARDLHYNAKTRLLAAATWGRGVFVASLDDSINGRVRAVIGTVNRILFGIVNDGPGAYLGPDGKIHPWGPGDPVPFAASTAIRRAVVALALAELSGRRGDRRARDRSRREAAALLMGAARRLRRAMRG